MSGLPLDLSQLDGDVQREFLECRHTREVLALARAESESVALARQLEGDRLRERKSVEGLGAPIAEISATSFNYWGLRLGYECWHDNGFVREYLRDNPQARVKGRGVKEIQVGYTADYAEPSPGRRADGKVEQKVTKETEEGQRARFRKGYGGRVGEKMMGRSKGGIEHRTSSIEHRALGMGKEGGR